MTNFSSTRRLLLALPCAGLLALSAPLAYAEDSCRNLDLAAEYGFDQPVTSILARSSSDNFYVAGAFQGRSGAYVNYVASADVIADVQVLWRPVSSYVNGVLIDGPITAIAHRESPSQIFVAGDFRSGGGSTLNHIARVGFDEWVPLDSGGETGLQISQGSVEVRALTGWDDGSGWALYAAGIFDRAGDASVDGLARWDGTSWSALPDPEPSADASYSALTVWDDGNQEVLVVGGTSGTIRAWNGTTWQTLGAGFDRWVRDLTVWEGALYTAGTFDPPGSSDNRGFVAQWSGQSWLDLTGAELDGAVVYALAGSPSGATGGLYAGGSFQSLGDAAASYFARWDGLAWNEVADAGGGLDGTVFAIDFWDRFFDEEKTMVVGGEFSTAGGEPVSQVALWNGLEWSGANGQMDAAIPSVQAFAFHETGDGGGVNLYAGGSFGSLGGQRTDGIARWNGLNWQPLSDSAGTARIASVESLADWNRGSPRLYAGGRFYEGVSAVVRVGWWDGLGWHELPDLGAFPLGDIGNVSSLEVWDDGSGEALYALGSFWFLDGGWASLAKWDGQAWEILKPGAPVVAPGDLEIWDDGTGEALYLAQGGLSRWDGQQLVELPTFDTFFDSFIHLEALETDGASLLVAAEDGQNGAVASWNGTAWSPFGTGLGFGRRFRSLEVWDDGNGPRLYLGGSELLSGADPETTLAMWDGSAWVDVSYSPAQRPGHSVDALFGGIDGQASSLFVGGRAAEPLAELPVTVTARTCGSPCGLDPTRQLCLGSTDRFSIDVTWRDFDSNEGSGRVVPFQTDDSGLFYFFDADNWEMLVKVLDACSFNDHFWVFSAATTNVEYTLTVTDTIAGADKTWFNPLGTAAPAVTDTEAFATCDANFGGSSQVSSAALTAQSLQDAGLTRTTERVARMAEKMNCVASDTVMCLEDGRFALEIDWRDFDGNNGQGQVVAGTPSDDSGLFQFFGEENWEVLVKVLDACGFNDRFWVFSAATTNVEYTLRVTDTETAEAVSYFNPLGNAASAVTDTDAFATCQ